MVKAFKSTLEDIEEKRSIHSLQYLNRQRPITEISFIDDELKGIQPADHYPYEIRKINILSSLRNHLNSTSLASQLSAHELIGTNDDQQSKQQLIEEQAKPGGGGFSVIFMPSRSNRSKHRPLNQRALTAPTTTINRLPTIRSNSVSNDVLVDNLADPTGKSNDSPPTSSSNESPLNIANKDASAANSPLVQGYHLMHETSI